MCLARFRKSAKKFELDQKHPLLLEGGDVLWDSNSKFFLFSFARSFICNQISAMKKYGNHILVRGWRKEEN